MMAKVCFQTLLDLIFYFCLGLASFLFDSLQGWTNERAEFEMDLVESTVRCIRSLRAEVLGKQKNER